MATDEQMRKAAEQSQEMFDRMGKFLEDNYKADARFIRPDKYPAWLSATIDTFNEMMVTGTSRACWHVALVEALPRNCVAWEPGLYVCGPCIAAGNVVPPRESDKEYQCDGCLTVDRRGLHITMIRLSPIVTLYAAICDKCHSEMMGITEE